MVGLSVTSMVMAEGEDMTVSVVLKKRILSVAAQLCTTTLKLAVTFER